MKPKFTRCPNCGTDECCVTSLDGYMKCLKCGVLWDENMRCAKIGDALIEEYG